MRRRVLALAVALLPAVVPALDWSGRVGADYTRTDTWANGGDRLAYPQLDLNVGLDANGFLSSSDLLDWTLAANYLRTSTSGDAAKTTRENLDFRGNATAFRQPGSPVTLHLFADRATTDYTAAGTGVEDTSTALSFGGTARFVAYERPSLTVGYTWSEQDSHGSLFGDARQTRQSVSAATTMGPGPFSVTAAYTGNFSEGTYASDNFDDHRANIDARARIDALTSLQLSDSYYLRVPTLADGVNPRQELNFFSGVLGHGEGLDYQQVGYRYSHALQTEGLGADTERANQRLDYTNQTVWAPEWRLRVRADLALQQDRLGTTEARSTGETLGAFLYWARKDEARSQLEIHGGPSVALLQPDAEDGRVGYGAGAGASWSRAFAPYTVRLQYDANYASDLHAVQGWSLTQSATAAAARPLASGILTADATARAAAFDSQLLGPSASRQLELGGRYSWNTYTTTARVLLSSNMHGTVNESLSGDGLFIPPGYDSHSRSVMVGAAARMFRYLSLSGDLRFTDVDLPDRPGRTELEIRGSVEWGYGALRIGIEDRYFKSEADGSIGSRNLLLLKVYRVFGSRY